jgi:hypothetical protein
MKLAFAAGALTVMPAFPPLRHVRRCGVGATPILIMVSIPARLI